MLRTPSQLLIGSLLAALLLVPAIVLARGGNGPSGEGPLVTQVVWSSGQPASTDSNQFADVPNMSIPNALTWNNPVTVDVSADMTAGSARFRVVADPTDTPLHPDQARFIGKGGATFQFFSPSSDVTEHSDFDVQWRRVGHKPASAADVVATLSGEID